MNGPSEELILLIGRLDGKVDKLLKVAEDCEGRILSLEKDRWRVTGAFAVLLGIVGWFNHERLVMLTAMFGAH